MECGSHLHRTRLQLQLRLQLQQRLQLQVLLQLKLKLKLIFGFLALLGTLPKGGQETLQVHNIISVSLGALPVQWHLQLQLYLHPSSLCVCVCVDSLRLLRLSSCQHLYLVSAFVVAVSSICLSICLSACLSVCPFVCLSACLLHHVTFGAASAAEFGESATHSAYGLFIKSWLASCSAAPPFSLSLLLSISFLHDIDPLREPAAAYQIVSAPAFPCVTHTKRSRPSSKVAQIFGQFP